MTTYNKKRLVQVVLLAYLVLTAANYYFGLGILPKYARLIVLLGVLMQLVYMTRFAPTREEFEEHRRRDLNN